MATELYDLTVPVFIRGLQALSGLLEKGAAFAQEKGNRACATAVCAKLRALLEDNDAEVPAIFDKNKAILTRAFPDSFRRLETAINRYDYDIARSILEGESLHGE